MAKPVAYIHKSSVRFRVRPLVPWCNGSIRDLDSRDLGSNPDGATIWPIGVGLAHKVVSLETWVRFPNRSPYEPVAKLVKAPGDGQGFGTVG